VIKGVPEELQAAYNLCPQQFDLLGVMADAADDNGEPEVAECLRWLWRWKRVARLIEDNHSSWMWHTDETLLNTNEYSLPESLRGFCPDWDHEDESLRAIERITIGFPKWKQQHSEEYQRLFVPPSTLTLPTTPS